MSNCLLVFVHNEDTLGSLTQRTYDNEGIFEILPRKTHLTHIGTNERGPTITTLYQHLERDKVIIHLRAKGWRHYTGKIERTGQTLCHQAHNNKWGNLLANQNLALRANHGQ